DILVGFDGEITWVIDITWNQLITQIHNFMLYSVVYIKLNVWPIVEDLEPPLHPLLGDLTISAGDFLLSTSPSSLYFMAASYTVLATCNVSLFLLFEQKRQFWVHLSIFRNNFERQESTWMEPFLEHLMTKCHKSPMGRLGSCVTIGFHICRFIFLE
ncbi:hypothetical protein L9F63_005070, partial [Diploptera punctata]